MTNPAQQTLAENTFERGRNQERLDAHVDQTRDRARRVVRMQRGEHEMPGERRLDRDLRRLQVAGLSNHDAVRVLSQKRAQNPRERQTDCFIHRNLHDSFQIVFHRFFRSDQFGIDRVDLP